MSRQCDSPIEHLEFRYYRDSVPSFDVSYTVDETSPERGARLVFFCSCKTLCRHSLSSSVSTALLSCTAPGRNTLDMAVTQIYSQLNVFRHGSYTDLLSVECI